MILIIWGFVSGKAKLDKYRYSAMVFIEIVHLVDFLKLVSLYFWLVGWLVGFVAISTLVDLFNAKDSLTIMISHLPPVYYTV